VTVPDKKVSLSNSSILPTIYITGLIGLASYNMLAAVIPLYVTKLGASVSEVGLIVAINAYCTALFMIPFGLLSDRFGRRILLLSGLIISTIVPFLYVFSNTILQLSVLRALHGIASATFVPNLMASVIDMSPPEQKGKSIGWYTTATQSGLMIGPIFGGFLLSSFGFEVAFIGSGVLSLVSLLVVITRFHLLPRKEAAKLELEASWSWLKQKALYGALLSPLVMVFGIGTLSAYIPLYVQDFGISATGAGLIITLCYASSAALRVTAGSLSDRIGRKPMILGGLLLSVIMMALIPQFNSLLLLSIVSFCYGIGYGILQPSAVALTSDLSPRKNLGLAASMFASAVHVGMAVGPTAMGAVAETSNLGTMFIACALSLAFGWLIIFVLFRIERKTGSTF
jgi:DHA1 family multidrug resistance protein-like MFS transporter